MPPHRAEAEAQSSLIAPAAKIDCIFSGATPVLRVARKHGQLADNQLYPLPKDCSPRGVSHEFHRLCTVLEKHETRVGLRMFKALVRLAWRPWAVTAVLGGISMGMSFVGPLVMQQVMILLQDNAMCGILERMNASAIPAEAPSPNGTHQGGWPQRGLPECRDHAWYEGYCLAAILGLARIVESLSSSHSGLYAFRVALRVHTALSTSIYRKCLRIGPAAAANVGKIQNLMAVDAEAVMGFAPMLNVAWLVPIQIVISFLWLSQLLGPSFLSGLGVTLFFFFPLQSLLTRFMVSARQRQKRLGDARVRLCNEAVQAAKTVKMYSWESATQRRIEDVRTKELATIQKTRLCGAAMQMIVLVQPLALTVVTFSTYAAVGNELTPPTVLTSLAILAQLRMTLGMLPMFVQMGSMVYVSFQRILHFLSNKELPEAVTLRDHERRHTSSVYIRGTFGWPSPPDLLPPRSVPRRCGARSNSKTHASASPQRGAADAGALAGKTLCVSAEGAALAAAAATKDSIAIGRRERRRSLCTAAFNSSAGEMAPTALATVLSTPSTLEVAQGGQNAQRHVPASTAPEEQQAVLRNVDLRLPAGQLIMVTGSVGSAKTSLLSALLGELVLVNGSDGEVGRMSGGEGLQPELGGSLAYFEQSPFILNETVRDNILLGRPLDEARYNATLRACAMTPDLRVLPGGDMTQIGERGVNLSGGQKARVALARSVYAQAAVQLLDDPLSAVDAHVGRHIFKHVLGQHGMLAGTTRILVTQQVQFLPAAEHILILEQGQVVAQGTYSELRHSSALLALLPEPPDAAPEDADGDEGEGGGPSVPRADRTVAHGGDSGAADEVKSGDARQAEAGSQIMSIEQRAAGHVSRSVYVAYAKALGGFGLVGTFLCFVSLERMVHIATDYWLAIWIDGGRSSSLPFPEMPSPNALSFYMPIYSASLLVAAALTYCRAALWLACMGIRASRQLYSQLTQSVLAAQTVFFETNPIGRIVNRFTSDTNTMDQNLLQSLGQWITLVWMIFGALLLQALINPYFFTIVPVLAVFYIFAYHLSAPAARDLQACTTPAAAR